VWIQSRRPISRWPRPLDPRLTNWQLKLHWPELSSTREKIVQVRIVENFFLWRRREGGRGGGSLSKQSKKIHKYDQTPKKYYFKM
jgi:hypothetical protein